MNAKEQDKIKQLKKIVATINMMFRFDKTERKPFIKILLNGYSLNSCSLKNLSIKIESLHIFLSSFF